MLILISSTKSWDCDHHNNVQSLHNQTNNVIKKFHPCFEKRPCLASLFFLCFCFSTKWWNTVQRLMLKIDRICTKLLLSLAFTVTIFWKQQIFATKSSKVTFDALPSSGNLNYLTIWITCNLDKLPVILITVFGTCR